MKYKTLKIALALFAALPLASAASEPVHRSDVLIRIQGPVTVNPGESIGTLWVIGNDVNVLGSVEELIVISGTARISGAVNGNVILIRSTGSLTPAARVGKDVLLYRSTLNSPAGTVAGTIHNERGVSFGAQALWMFWASVTIALVIAGLVFGYLFGDSLASVADQIRTDWRGILLVTAALVCGLPLAAVLSFMTGVGFILGFFIMFALIPALALLGFLVVGASLGRALLQVPESSRAKMFSSIALGVVVLQLMAIIPGIGGPVVLISSWLGAGALVSRAWKHEQRGLTSSRLIVQPV